MRGAHSWEIDPGAYLRIIPADAGSTTDGPAGSTCPRDHPRGCGEHGLRFIADELDYGSSPRMRGAQESPFNPVGRHRIIPADAGSTVCGVGQMAAGQDHPRGCGEHCQYSCGDCREEGSSPRMRGALAGLVAFQAELGIIPADAGSTKGGE